MKLSIYCVALCLYRATSSIHRNSGSSWVSDHSWGATRTRRAPMQPPAQPLGGEGVDKKQLAEAREAMREVAFILRFHLEPSMSFTDPSEYIARCMVMARRAKHSGNADGQRELESLYRENLLRTIFGKREAEKILTERGKGILATLVSENPREYADFNLDSVQADPLPELKRMASGLSNWNFEYIAKFELARPKYRQELRFLVGTKTADLILLYIRKITTEQLLELAPRSKSTAPGTKKPSDADRIYSVLKDNIGKLGKPFHVVSYENLDRLTLVLGWERAAELVIARGRLVLPKLLDRKVGNNEDIMTLCKDTIARLSTPALIKKVSPEYEQHLWFLLGRTSGTDAARHGFQTKL